MPDLTPPDMDRIVAARVVAVGVAMPAYVDIRGKQVRTSILRDRATAPLVLGPTGAEDNETAVHTEHLLAFSAEHYGYWANRFGVRADAWPYTHWGENLVVDGLTEEYLPIGTVLRIGSRAVLQVTSPRNPCFKLSWHLGQPDSVLPEILASGRTGFYLRVIAPGPVFDGDAIEVTLPAAPGATVADVARLMADPANATPAAIHAVLGLEGLGVQCAGMLRQTLTDTLDRSRTRQHRWPGWRAFEVGDMTDSADDVRSFALRPADGGPVAPYRAGQHVLARVTDRNGGSHVRAWSLSDYQEHPRDYRLSIRRGTVASALMHDQVVIGSTVELQAPAGSFCLDRSSNHPTVLISAGIGLTPLLAMLKAYAELGPAAPPVHWIHVARNGRTHAHRAEVAELVARCPNMRCHVRYTAPEPCDRPGTDYDGAGRLTEDALRREIAVYRYPIFGREVELPGAVSEFYLCGPAAFEDDVRRMLAAIGVAPGSIRSESFGGMTTTGTAAQVRFRHSATEVAWRPGMSLLDLAEEAGIVAEHECRAGTCHQCATAVLEGKVAYDRPPLVPPLPGMALICVGRPATPVLVLDL